MHAARPARRRRSPVPALPPAVCRSTRLSGLNSFVMAVSLASSPLTLPADPPPARGAQIHWFSIFNSFMMVIFLTGLVAMIMLRTLRRDYARYTQVRRDGVPAIGAPGCWGQAGAPAALRMLRRDCARCTQVRCGGRQQPRDVEGSVGAPAPRSHLAARPTVFPPSPHRSATTTTSSRWSAT